MRHFILTAALLVLTTSELLGQNALSLKECIQYAIENNHSLQKSKLDQTKSEQARKEILGALLPQLNGTSSIAYNFDKNTAVMPNFMNSMLPASMQDPNASKYMTIPMGMNYSANVGASLMQQVLNFSLFNAMDISRTTQEMADLGLEISTEDVIEKTATIYYNIQVLGYGLEQFDRSIALMDETVKVMDVNKANGIVRQVDLDRIDVAKTNLETQKKNLQQAREVQKNLLKLQMGYRIEDGIEVQPIDIESMESISTLGDNDLYDVKELLPFKMVKQKEQLSLLQMRSARYEGLPTLTLGANYTYNFLCDEFFRGESLHKLPVSLVSLNLRIPIFSGLSRQAKYSQAKIEMAKTQQDEVQLEQSLTMAHSNAQMQLDNSLNTIWVQKKNMKLAEDVYNVSENNYKEGICPLTDVLNASSSLIQSQMSYAEALNNYIQAYIQMKKSDGTIREIINQNQ
jgi:outer membrane protein